MNTSDSSVPAMIAATTKMALGQPLTAHEKLLAARYDENKKRVAGDIAKFFGHGESAATPHTSLANDVAKAFSGDE